MTIITLCRAVVAVAMTAFAAAALSIWIVPYEAAQALGLEPLGANGERAIRADLGGLFGGMAVLCAVALWTRSRVWALSAAAMLSAVMCGRVIGWIGEGGARDVLELAVEALAVFALLGLARPAPAVPEEAPLPRGSVRFAVGALIVVLLSGTAAMVSPQVQDRIFAAGAARRTAAFKTAPLTDDALRVAVCGTSAPLPSERRAKACVAVFAGGKYYVVDAGPESVENLVLWGIPLSAIGAVMVTHFHSDHIGDLGELNLQTWAGGRSAPLLVYGGPGVDEVVDGFNRAYRLDQGYRTAHHTARVMPPSTWPMVAREVLVDAAGPGRNRRGIVLQEGGLTVTAFEVDHAPISPAYAYRFDYRGRSVFVTGDLKYQASLSEAAHGVDVLVSEAIATQMTRALGAGAREAGRQQTATIMHDIEDYHLSPEQAATIANEAGAKLLVFYHLLPAPDGALARSVFARGMASIRPEGWTIADDGSLYEMPVGSTHVRIGRIGE